MPYLIDGHNLIGKVAGISLSDIDDEMALVRRLQAFCRLQRKQAEVFFDRAPLGSSGARSFGAVKAHFVRSGKTADEAIEEFLARLKGSASNWTVVSSDGRVQRAARRVHARVMSSEEFAAQLAGMDADPGEPDEPDGGRDEPGGGRDEPGGEADEWLKLFGGEQE